MPNSRPTDLRVAIAGLGPIGKKVAEALDQGIDGMVLAAVSAQNPEKHRSFVDTLATAPAVLPIEKLADVADIVIECAPAKLIRSIVTPFVTRGKTAIVLSAGAPYIVDNNIDIERITEPLKIFEGTAREAAKGFPANLNVAVALSLAGIGPDRTRLEIWADPTVTRNIHRVEVESDSARFSMSIENIPSENPKTGRITALSVIAYLRKQRATLRVGT
jgi:aspartate dehydrogenase